MVVYFINHVFSMQHKESGPTVNSHQTDNPCTWLLTSNSGTARGSYKTWLRTLVPLGKAINNKASKSCEAVMEKDKFETQELPWQPFTACANRERENQACRNKIQSKALTVPGRNVGKKNSRLCIYTPCVFRQTLSKETIIIHFTLCNSVKMRSKKFPSRVFTR